MPRIIFDRFKEDDYSKLLTYESERHAVADLLVDVCKRYSFDGIVFEAYSQLAGRVDEQHLLLLVEDIGLFHQGHLLRSL